MTYWLNHEEAQGIGLLKLAIYDDHTCSFRTAPCFRVRAKPSRQYLTYKRRMSSLYIYINQVISVE